PPRSTLFPYPTLFRSSLDDLGRLGHNLATAVAYSDVATTLGVPRGLVPLANLGYAQAVSLQGVPPVDIPSLEGAGPLANSRPGQDRKSTRLNSSHVAI